MSATTILLIVATVLNVEGGVARIDRGYHAGLRADDVGTFFYQLSVGGKPVRIDTDTGTVIETTENHALLRVEGNTVLRPGYRVELRIAVPVEAGRTLLQQVRDPPIESAAATHRDEAKVLPSPADASVGEFVSSWAQAWSDQRVDDYLEHYASNYRLPNGMSRSDWASQRSGRVLAPASIAVRIEELEIVSVASRVAVATFVQFYRSNTYEDRVPKLLDLVRESGQWRILEERLAK